MNMAVKVQTPEVSLDGCKFRPESNPSLAERNGCLAFNRADFRNLEFLDCKLRMTG